jgi:hypothetical protein
VRSWTIGVLAASALVGAVGYAWAVRQPDNGSPAPPAAATKPSSSPASSTPATSPPAPPTAATPLSGIGAPPAGPALAITVHVQPAGDVVVPERLAWTPAKASAQLAVSMPSRISGPGVPTGKYASPHVTGLQVAYDGQVVRPEPDPPGQRWTITAPTSTPGAHVLELRYRVTGVAVPSTPGPPGRATVVIDPLLLGAANVPAWLAVIGPAGGVIHGVNCPLAAPERVVCADERSGGWLIVASRARSTDLRVVTVQADLPAGG